MRVLLASDSARQVNRLETIVMAGIDKIYGTQTQRRELKRFIRRLRIPGYRKRALYRNFYPIGNGEMLTSFTCAQDRFLWRQSGLPAWARERIAEQYNGGPDNG